jgi:hypothetical protein
MEYTILDYCAKLNLVAAKQNQKFPFHFLSAPPTPPAENIKKGRKIFGFVPRPKGADEARHSAIGAYASGSSHHALRACEVSSRKG